MALVATRGIITGAPNLNPSDPWTPPHMGPADYAHCWMAHTLLGAGTVTSVPDMVGQANLSGTFDSFDPSAPALKFSTSSAQLICNTTSAERVTMTMLLVAEMPAAGDAPNMVKVPGYYYGPYGGKANFYGAANVTTGLTIGAGRAIHVVTFKNGGSRTVINGQDSGSIAVSPHNTADVWAFGSQLTTATYGIIHMRVWLRELSTTERADVTAAAKAFHGVTW